MSEIKFYSSACILSGVLRALSSFIDYEAAHESIELLYMAIDLGFILGLIGLHTVFRHRWRWLGRAGFIISICGFALIAGPEANLFGIGIYQIGSPIVGVGILLLSLELLRSRICGLVAPITLIASVLLGLVSMLTGIKSIFVVTGILFGIGFVVLGTKLWSSR